MNYLTIIIIVLILSGCGGDTAPVPQLQNVASLKYTTMLIPEISSKDEIEMISKLESYLQSKGIDFVAREAGKQPREGYTSVQFSYGAGNTGGTNMMTIMMGDKRQRSVSYYKPSKWDESDYGIFFEDCDLLLKR